MIIRKSLPDNRIHTWSDLGMMIRQNETGILYEDAIDVPGRYTYTETDEPIPSDSADPTPEDYETALNRLGVET